MTDPCAPIWRHSTYYLSTYTDTLWDTIYDLGSRSTRTAMNLLKDYSGAIQSDGYEVYDLFDGLDDKTMLGCWAHARRKFTEAMSEDNKLASEVLVYIGDLYHVETLAREAGISWFWRYRNIIYSYRNPKVIHNSSAHVL